MKSDKDIEHDRYESRARSILKQNSEAPANLGLGLLPAAIRSPYICYEAFIKKNITHTDLKALDIGAGTGVVTGMIVETGVQTVATDISESALKILQERVSDLGKIETQVADMESLPFDDGSFDIVLSAGSLSYGDNTIVRDEIYRVLKKGGKFICVDSLNHNPIYRFNRWVQYLRKQRSLSTILQMPTRQLIKSYETKFGKLEDRYYGSVSWAAPLLSLLFGAATASRISDRIDALLGVSNSAFKFVMVVEKIK